MGGNLCDVELISLEEVRRLPEFVQRLVRDTKKLIGDTLPESAIEQEIRWCLEGKKFSFIAQGIFDKEGVLRKTELLARLQGDDGAIFPDVFIPVIGDIGQSTLFDYMVLEKAFESISQAQPNVPCAININPTTFENDGFLLGYLERLEKRYGVDPSMVILEILETEPIHAYADFNRTLSKLRKRGYKIAVDDFHPVGNHNIFCIDHLQEIDTVKFDGVYMCELYSHRGEHSVTQELRGTLSEIMRKHPNVDIVIEKIENREMFEFFRDLFMDFGIDDIRFQGYYFDRGSAF